MGLVREDGRQLRVRHLVGLVVHVLALVVVEAHPGHITEPITAFRSLAFVQGDLAVCASEYETMARTPFEQAESGQALLLHDKPWIDDCMPENYRLLEPRRSSGDCSVGG